jgi:hypothetical protein
MSSHLSLRFVLAFAALAHPALAQAQARQQVIYAVSSIETAGGKRACLERLRIAITGPRILVTPGRCQRARARRG